MRKKIDVTSDQWTDTEPPAAPSPETAEQDLGDAVSFEGPAPDDGDNGAAAGAHEAEPAGSLQAELDEARRQIEDLKKQVVYAQADFQNFRRRKEEEQKDLARFANAELNKSLLPVLDNFERALQAAEQTRNFDALIGGISGTSKQMQAFLQKAGVTPIETLGKDFDPNFHEAIGHAENTEYAANKVAEEVQRGYVMHDRVLRPALVRVAQD